MRRWVRRTRDWRRSTPKRWRRSPSTIWNRAPRRCTSSDISGLWLSVWPVCCRASWWAPAAVRHRVARRRPPRRVARRRRRASRSHCCWRRRRPGACVACQRGIGLSARRFLHGAARLFGGRGSRSIAAGAEIRRGHRAYKAGDFLSPRGSSSPRSTPRNPDLPSVWHKQQDAYYNLGNTLYREGQRTEKSDAGKTIETWSGA